MRRLTASIVSAAILAGCAASPAPAATPTTAASPSASLQTTAPTPTPTASAASIVPTAGGWLPAEDQAAVTGAQFQDVVWTGSRFVATGVALDTGGGVFLDSTDGRTWHRQLAASGGQPFRLGTGSRGVLAVGEIDNHPATWFSPDGLGWTSSSALPIDPSGTDVVEVKDVVATARGWLAVGREDPYCNTNCGLAPVRALAWTSDDGLRWTPVGDQTSFTGGGMNAVVASANGYVAVGVDASHAAAWTSGDGATWARVADVASFHPQPATDPSAWAMMVAAAAGHGIVVILGMAFGVGPGGAPAILAWSSADGRTWAPATGAEFPGGQPSDVTATPDGFLIVGGSSQPDCPGGIWSSADGRVWTCVAKDRALDGFGPYAVAASPTAEVAVGLTSVGWDQSGGKGLPGAVWWRAFP